MSRNGAVPVSHVSSNASGEVTAVASPDAAEAWPAAKPQPGLQTGLQLPVTVRDWEIFVRDLQQQSQIPPAAAGVCRSGCSDTSLPPAIRNSLANALIDMQPADPELHHLFLDMIDDSNDAPVWRVYCIQFAALCYPFAAGRETIVDELFHLVNRTDGDFAGTAMMQLYQLNRELGVPLPIGFWPAVQHAAEAEDPVLLTAAFGLLAAHPDTVDRAFWTACLERPLNVRRFAVAALGKIGNQDDLALLQQLARSGDSRLAMAARTSVLSVQARLAGATAEYPLSDY